MIANRFNVLVSGLAAGIGGAAVSAEQPAGELPELRGYVVVGELKASHPLRDRPLPGAAGSTEAPGDTFDSELLIADTPALGVWDWLSAAPGGQSVLFDGFLQPAGTSSLTGFPLQAGVAEFPGAFSTVTLQTETRIAPFSDGFLPVGFTFSPGGEPIETLEWRFGVSADRDANPDPLDPNLMVVFPPAGAFTILAADVFLLDNGVVLGSAPLSGLPAFNQTEINHVITIDGAAGSRIDQIVVQYLTQSATAGPEIELVPSDTCLGVGETQLIVEVNAQNLVTNNVGGQFFLEYDNALLDFVSIVPGDAPFTREVYIDVDEPAGEIDYAVGVPDGDGGTILPGTMARITFDVLGEFCDVAGLVSFRPGAVPPSRLTDALGNDLGAATLDLVAVTADTTPPSVTPPADLTVNADAGLCTALVATGTASAIDSCSAVTLTAERDDNPGLTLADPFPVGTTSITWTATDECGNSASAVQLVTVEPENTVDVVVELQATVAAGPFERCISFELDPVGAGPLVEVSGTFTFVGGVATGSVEVPCGQYECITARDELHTLRRTDNDDFGIAGAVYTAAFDSAGDDDTLPGGNLNGDSFVDILDFGVFIAQFGTSVGADTPCGAPGPHADVTGDGFVGTGDFTFVQINFLGVDELRCDGSLTPPAVGGLARAVGAAIPTRGPIRSISVERLKRLGLGHLGRADLNGDGTVDEADVASFALGTRPQAAADSNSDGVVDAADLVDVIARLGEPAGDGNDPFGDGWITLDDVLVVADLIWRKARP